MTAAEVDGDCEFRAVVFEGHVDCDRLLVKGKLEMRAQQRGIPL